LSWGGGMQEGGREGLAGAMTPLNKKKTIA